MSNKLKVILFGIVSGLIWTLIAFRPSTLGDSDYQSILIMLAVGIATGLAVSFALKIPLEKYGILSSLILGLLALPFGAFIFGFLFMLLSMVAGNTTGADANFQPIAPFVFGFYAALTSVMSQFYLFPVAVLTTFILRKLIRSGNNNLSLKH